MLNKRFQQGNAFLPYLTLVVIAGLVTINLWLYFWGQKEITALQPQTVDTTTDQLAGWQTYTNNELGYEIKYPPEWSAKKMNMLGGYIHLAGPEVTTEQGLLPKGSDLHYLEIFPWDGKTIPVSTVKDQDGKFLQFENIKTVTVGPITGQQGDLVGIPYKTISLLRGNTNGVRIEWETTNDDHYHKLYQQILSTFHFTDDMSNWKTYTDNEWNLTFKYPADWKVDGQSQEKSLSIIPPDVKKKTSIELDPSIGIRAVATIPPTAPIGTSPEKTTSDYDCNQNRRAITINGITAEQQDESCFATIRSTYIPNGQGYLVISWATVFEKDYPQYEQILSTFRFTDSLSNWKTYANDKSDYTFTYPKSWVADDCDSNGQMTIITPAPIPCGADWYGDGFVITQLKDTAEREKYLTELKRNLVNLQVTTINIANKSATRITGTYKKTAAGDGINIPNDHPTDQVFVTNNSTEYLIMNQTFAVSSPYAKEFETFLSTFHFTK